VNAFTRRGHTHELQLSAQPRFLRAGERAPRLSERWPAARGAVETFLPSKATNARFQSARAASGRPS